MARACLAEIRPLNLLTGERDIVRVTQLNDRRVTGLGGSTWTPAMTNAPVIGIALWNGDFLIPVDSGTASFDLNRAGLLEKKHPDINRYYWQGAPVVLYAEEPGMVWPWAIRFRGSIRDISDKNTTLTLTATVETEPFDKNLLALEYEGTGGVEGVEDLKDRVKPLVLGWAKNVEPVLIDTINSVFQFSAYGPIEAVSAVYERASSFGAAVGNYANYAALVAANIPAGRFGTCLNEGLIRLGAPPYGVITGDIRGHAINGVTPRLTGAMIHALATIGGVDEERLDAISLDAMDVAVPFPINLVLDQQATFFDMARTMAMSCNYQAGISLLGKFFATQIDLGAPEVLTLHAKGQRRPQVKGAPEELTTSVPYWKTVMGAARCWRTQSKDEIAFYAELVEMGLFNPSAVYREGNIVQMEDGSRFIYINATPSSGNTPPNGTYWGQLSGAVGENSNLIFRKATTKPSIPSPSSGVPSGWVDDIGSVGGADQPVWASYGTKASGGATYTWQTPYAVSSDKRLFDALDGDGSVKPGQVDTPAIVDEGVNRTGYVSGTTQVNFNSATKTQVIQIVISKETAGSILICDFQSAFYGPDAIDGDIFIEAIVSGTIVRTRTQRIEKDLNQASRDIVRFRAVFTGLGAGTITIRVSFENESGETCRTDGEYDLDVTERMK